MRLALVCVLLWIFLAAISCSSLEAPTVADQLAQGQQIYTQSCATTTCHGVNGEGIRSGDSFRDWPLVGEVFQQRNPTAQVIFDVVRSGGESSLRDLTDQQVYDAIAYELSLNEVDLSQVLVSKNAPVISSGPAAEAKAPGSLFPPPGNARLIPDWSAPYLPLSAENDDLRIRLTQMALAPSIAGTLPPGGGRFVLVVFTLEVLVDHPLQVGPQHLRLETADGHLLEPQEIHLAYPVARFYAQNIQPEHGTAALAIFALKENDRIARLRYEDASIGLSP